MFSFMIFCHVWILQTVLICCSENATVVRVSVPEEHHVRLPCGRSVSSDVVWTHEDRRVPVTRQGSYETNDDPRRYLLLSDGSLRLLQLDDSDSGEYRCNQRLVAELQVLTGQPFAVPAGRTLLLPCGRSSRLRQRWVHRRDGGRRELIFTWFRNGTMRPERSRLGYEEDALQIQDLQPEDSGLYQCNGRTWTRVSVLPVQLEPTRVQRTSGTTSAVAAETDEAETQEEKRPENALLLVAAVSLGLMVVLLAVVCVLLTSIKCRRRKRKRKYAGSASQRREDTELQLWKAGTTGTTSSRQTGTTGTASSRQTGTTGTASSRQTEVHEGPSLPEETIHYASLGRQNWRERPCRTPPDQDHHAVIYSSVVTK